MTRTYIAKRLLEHGALSMREFLEITRWKPRQAHRAIQQLVKTGIARPINPPRLRHATRLYELVSSSTTDGLQPSTESMRLGHTAERGSNCHG